MTWSLFSHHVFNGLFEFCSSFPKYLWFVLKQTSAKSSLNGDFLFPFVFVKNGLTPLHIAAHYGHVDIAELLLKRGADTDARARVSQSCSLDVALNENIRTREYTKNIQGKMW